ncbi:MAG: PHP domain-containing protein [Saprospiraceae bacterium]|nr:PHP domain-containing protein [Saprospiraceae bacterium]
MKKEDKWLRVEFHCHTSISRDSSNHLPHILQVARQRGLDRLAITDHNTIANALRAKEMDPELVIVGEEIKTTRGELLAYFVTRGVPKNVPPMAAIDLLKQQNAFISVAHPFDYRRSGWTMDELQKILPYLDAIEVFNSRCFKPSVNQAALEFTEKNKLAKMVGSDAHSQMELGLSTLKLPQFNSADELRQVIRQAQMDTRPFSSWAHVCANTSILLGRLMPWNWGRK